MPTSSESDAFNATLAELRPGQATRCVEWRVHELACHIAAGAAEIRRNVEAYNQGGPEAVPETRELDEREEPFRGLALDELRSQIATNTDAMMGAIGVALEKDPEAVTPWVGRQMPIAAFLTHARSEYAVHRWDLVGDDDISIELLAQPELTAHAVMALGEALVQRGLASIGQAGPPTGEVVLASQGQPPILVSDSGVSFLEEPGDLPVVEADPAARLLLLWGRFPDRPSRVESVSGLEPLVTLRKLLAGY